MSYLSDFHLNPEAAKHERMQTITYMRIIFKIFYPNKLNYKENKYQQKEYENGKYFNQEPPV